MLLLLLQNHDWCTNGPCAGSINPIIPWSMCDGSSHDKCVLLYFFEKNGNDGAAGTSFGNCPAALLPGAVMYTQTYPSRSSHGKNPTKIPNPALRSCPAPPRYLHAKWWCPFRSFVSQ